MQRKRRLWHKIVYLALIFSFIFQQAGFAQGALELNLSGYLARMQSSMTIDKFRPMHLRYFNYDINSHNFKILIDKGDLKNPATGELENSSKDLLNYFLVGLTLRNESFWVNLRPDSQDQIIDNYLVQTDVGRIMLETDLQLKKDTAKLTSPETPEGREYWNKLYKKAEEIYGYENITIPTLTRPWIVPGEIIIHETDSSAYIYKATLKVMLEQDYLKDSNQYNFSDPRLKVLNEYSSELIRELIIPKLTKEVNSSKRYANIRQVYYSLILSRWFKNKFAGQTGGYASRINTQDLTGITSKEPWSKTTYFKEYQKSFKEGEYNLKEPVYTPTGQVIRSYFSGGIQMGAEAGSPINNRSGFTSGPISPKVFLNADVLMEGEAVVGSPIKMTRRDFLKGVGAGAALVAFNPVLGLGEDNLKKPVIEGEKNNTGIEASQEQGQNLPASNDVTTLMRNMSTRLRADVGFRIEKQRLSLLKDPSGRYGFDIWIQRLTNSDTIRDPAVLFDGTFRWTWDEYLSLVVFGDTESAFRLKELVKAANDANTISGSDGNIRSELHADLRNLNVAALIAKANKGDLLTQEALKFLASEYNNLQAKEALRALEKQGSLIYIGKQAAAGSPIIIDEHSMPPREIAKILSIALQSKVIDFPGHLFDYYAEYYIESLVKSFLEDFGRAPTINETADFYEKIKGNANDGKIVGSARKEFAQSEAKSFVNERIRNISYIVDKQLLSSSIKNKINFTGDFFKKWLLSLIDEHTNRYMISAIKILSGYLRWLAKGSFNEPKLFSYEHYLEYKAWGYTDMEEFTRIYEGAVIPFINDLKDDFKSRGGYVREELERISEILDAAIRDTSSAAGSPLTAKEVETILDEILQGIIKENINLEQALAGLSAKLETVDRGTLEKGLGLYQDKLTADIDAGIIYLNQEKSDQINEIGFKIVDILGQKTRAEGLTKLKAKELAQLASFQGLSAGKATSFILESVKATNFISSLIELSGLSEGEALDRLEKIKGLSSVLSKFRLSSIDLEKTGVEKTDETMLEQPLIAELAREYKETVGLEVSLTQPAHTIVSKKEQGIIEKHHAITRELMAQKDSRHSPVFDPEESLNYRGKVREYYNREFLTGDAKKMEDLVDTHFTKKGRELRFIVKVGIGANEEYDHYTRAVYERKENGIVYAVMNNSYEFEEFRKRHPDANGENTLIIYESRSGETEEPLKVFLFNFKYFPVSIVFSNKGPLHDTAEGWIKKQEDRGETATILRLDFRTDMAGRYMRRKTPMSYCALHLLNEIGHKPEERITNSPEIKTITTLMKRIKSGESGLEDEVLKLEQSLQNKFAERWAYKYMLVTDKADKLLTFTKNDESLAVQTSEFIHRNQMLSRKVKGGRDQFALIVNDAEILWPATEQPIQNWMEGVNKPGNKLIMNRYLFSDEPHAIQGILDQADSHIAFFVLNKKHPSYQEAKKKASEMQAKGIPLIVIEMDEPTMENTAGFSTFIEDFIVYYAGIIGQDPYTNPEVKYVRENSDSRLEVMADFKRDWLRLEAIPAAKKEEKSLKPKEVNPEDTALINFLSLFNQAGVALGIYPREVFSSLENNLDGELVVNAFAEANGVHRQTAIDGIKKAGVFSKVVVDYNEAMRKKEEVQKLKADKSAFIDEGTVKQKAKDIGITDIYFSLGPSDIPVDKAILGSLKKTYENIRGEDSLAKRIAEFIHLSAYVLKKDGVRRDNIVLTTNDQYRLGFAKAFKEFWGKNVSKLTKFILGIDMLPRASHLIIEGRLGQADSHFNIVVLAEELGLSKGHVLSREDVEFSNPAHQGLDRNEALFGLALGNEETILAKMPGIYIKVKEITPETDQMLAQLFKEVSEHYAKILTKVATSQTPEGEVKASLTEQASPFSSAELFTLENELGVVNVRESEPRKVTYYLTLGYQLSVKYMAEIDKSVIIFTSPFTLPNLSKAGLSLERKFDGDWYNSPFGNIMKELAEVVKEEENSASSAVRIFRGTGKRSFEIPLTYEYDQLITGRQILVVYKDKVEVARINLKTLQGYKIHNPVYSEMTERSYSADDGSFRIRINEDSMDFTSYVDGTFEVYVKSASSAVQADTVSHQSDSLVTESEFSSMLQAGDADFRFVNSLVMEFLKRRGNQEDTIGYIWDVNFSIGNLHFEKLRLRGKPGQEYTLNLINSSKHAININWYNNGVIVVQQTDKDMLTFMNRYGNAVTRIKEELEKVASSAVQAKDYAENSLEFAKFLEEILAGREDTVIDYDEAVDSFVMQGNRLKLDGGWQESINTNPASQITVSIQEGTKLMTVRKKSVSSPINRSGIDASFRSASIPDKGMGGIDFRALPMTIKPMGSFEGLNLRLPQLSSSALISFNLDEEVAQLNQMVSSGIIPSGSRVQELVAAAWQKGKLQDYQTEILTLLAEICKLQEGECCESSDEFKVALVAVNAV